MDDVWLSGISSGSRIEWALRFENTRAEGRHDALSFAVNCQGDEALIAEELRERDELVTAGASRRYGPMAPGSSPRAYQDAFIQGLRDALEIIARVKAEEEAGE
jgi:hypothetical protein